MNEPKRTSPWVWVGIGCGVLVVGCVVFVAFIAFVAVGAMRSSTPYKDAMQRAQTDPRVIEALGSPIEPGLFISGSINTQNQSGDADLSIPVSGPKGKARISVKGTKDEGRWTYTRMTVTPAKGEPIDLLANDTHRENAPHPAVGHPLPSAMNLPWGEGSRGEGLA